MSGLGRGVAFVPDSPLLAMKGEASGKLKPASMAVSRSSWEEKLEEDAAAARDSSLPLLLLITWGYRPGFQEPRSTIRKI